MRVVAGIYIKQVRQNGISAYAYTARSMAISARIQKFAALKGQEVFSQTHDIRDFCKNLTSGFVHRDSLTLQSTFFTY
jgi:hypothetical protein